MRLLGKTWISKDNNIFQNALGVLLAIPLVILACLIKLIIIPFEQPSHVSKNEIRNYLYDFLNDQGDAFDWDDFISIEIEDPELEDIRRRARNIELPLNEKGAEIVRQLLLEVENLSAKEVEQN